MARKTADQKKHEDLLKRARELGGVRVKVVNLKGERIYVDIDLVADADEIQTNKDGEPIVMRAKPGRKGKTPSAARGDPANSVIREQVKRKTDAVMKDPILKALNANPDSPDVLNQVIRGIGEEAASLSFERLQADLEGKETATLSSRRIQALRAMGDTWIKRMDQIANKSLDLDGPAFAKVFGFIIESFREALTAIGYREEEIDTVVAKFSSMVNDDWKNEAKNRIKSL